MRSAEWARSLAEETVPLIHEAGNPYYDWFFGGAEQAREAVEALYASPASEVSATRVTLLLEDERLRGLYVALPGEELAECRLADTLLLVARDSGATRAELRRRIELARGLFADVLPADCYLSKIGVVRASRGQGLGGTILDRVIAEARERGHSRVRLDVSAGNERALALYAARGFAIVRERRVGPLVYLELVRDLAQP